MTARLAIGILLIAIGAGALLQALDVAEVPWQAVLSVALIAIGLLLALAPGRHGGVLTIGIVLTVVLALFAVLEVTFEGGVGQRTHRPAAAEQVRDEYRLSIGEMVVDLSQLDLSPGITTVEASIGIGHLVVILPDDATVAAEAHAGIGEVVLLADRDGGFGVDRSLAEPGYDDAEVQLSLDLDVGIGQIEVKR